MDDEGRIGLHYAALANDATAAESMLAAGEDPDAVDHQGSRLFTSPLKRVQLRWRGCC
jgi:ankyrin repeat protein